MNNTPSSSPPPEPSWARWVDLFLALGLVVAFVVLQVVLALALAIAILALQAAGVVAQSPVELAQDGVVLGGASMAVGLLVMALTWLVASWAGQRPFRPVVALVPPRVWLLWAAPLLAVGTALALDGVTAALGKPIVPEILLPAFQGLAAVAVMALSTVVVAPLAEELLFRGALFHAIARFVPVWFTVLLTALVFGTLHVMTYGDDWYTILQTVVAGLILGGLRAWTRSLWPGIVFHATMNLYATIQVVVLVYVLAR